MDAAHAWLPAPVPKPSDFHRSAYGWLRSCAPLRQPRSPSRLPATSSVSSAPPAAFPGRRSVSQNLKVVLSFANRDRRFFWQESKQLFHIFRSQLNAESRCLDIWCVRGGLRVQNDTTLTKHDPAAAAEKFPFTEGHAISSGPSLLTNNLQLTRFHIRRQVKVESLIPSKKLAMIKELNRLSLQENLHAKLSTRNDKFHSRLDHQPLETVRLEN